MNNEIKVSLSIVLPGRTILSQQVAENKPNESFDTFSMEISDANGLNREIIHVKTRKCIPASQSINISKDGYDAMTDKDNCPHWSKAGTWTSMNAKMRLEAHLKKITEGLGGSSFTYQVFED